MSAKLRGLLPFVALVIAWAVVTRGALIPAIFLPRPEEVFSTGVEMIRDGSLWVNIGASLGRVLLGTVVSVPLAVGFGVLVALSRRLASVLEPIASFFNSLDKVAAYGSQVTVALPAHGQPFADLAGRAKSIQEHHLGRLDIARAASEEAGRPLTVSEMSTHLFSPRAQGPMADSETFAHLEHLRLLGAYRRTDTDEGYLYEPA